MQFVTRLKRINLRALFTCCCLCGFLLFGGCSRTPSINLDSVETVDNSPESTNSPIVDNQNAKAADNNANITKIVSESSPEESVEPKQEDTEIAEVSEDLEVSESTTTTESEPAEDQLAQATTETPQQEQASTPHPFPRRIAAAEVPEFPKDLDWLNSGGRIRLKDLKGKFVLLDFWTYCCINCLHVLPELKKLEKAYPNNLVVIGVHSAKFQGEKDSKNISEAVMRHEIEHPVINDFRHEVWYNFGVRSWPTLVLIDPNGDIVGYQPGESKFEFFDDKLKAALPYYRKNGLLDETPLHFELLASKQKNTPLRFPGKILADPKTGRLFIADSNHNRIVIAKTDGTLLETIGSGKIGRTDGSFAEAAFDHLQGMFLLGDLLYVADTENHLIRKVDLGKKTVTTIAGVGSQGRNAWPGTENLGPFDEPPLRFVGKPLETGLNSPWALWAHDKNLYIAMAGPHQIWKMTLDETEIGPYAGNGREDIVDGPLLPPVPHEPGYSSFAQPSGLASDGQWLYVADSEGSSIRAVPFDPKAKVKTVVGPAHRRANRLFIFGDQDGRRPEVLLQHALGVVYHDGNIYVADTYNNKIKVVDAKSGDTKTIAGTGKPGSDDSPGTFDEPAGLTYAAGKLFIADTNNHLIRIVDLENNNRVATLEIPGLTAPKISETPKKPSFRNAKQISVDPVSLKAIDAKVQLSGSLKLPTGWKINPLAPLTCYIESTSPSGPIDRSSLSRVRIDPPTADFKIPLSISGEGKETLKVSLSYYYCQEGAEGLCKIGSVVWTVPVTISNSAPQSELNLMHQVSP